MVIGRIPAQSAKGDQLITFHRVNSFISNGDSVEILLVSAPFQRRDEGGLARFKKIFPQVKVKEIKVTLSDIFRSLISDVLQRRFHPIQSTIFKSWRAYEEIVRRSQSDFDQIYVATARLTPLVQHPLVAGMVIVDLIDSLSLNLHRELLIKPWKAPFLRIELSLLTRYERSVAGNFSKVIMVSRIDAEWLEAENIRVIPIGVELQSARPVATGISEPQTVLFIGNLNYGPNHDAIMWFIEHCWSRILNVKPNTRLVVVGGGARRSLVLASRAQNVVLAGFVEDLSTIMASASVSIAPMRSGSGMQNKVLEAMAVGCAVVTTILGKGDIDREGIGGLSVANTPGDFAAAVLRFLQDARAAQDVGESSRRYIQQVHELSKVDSTFLDFVAS